ncbi:MAG: Unknown protein [uncultured Sulfurovum sp.]|uniref:DUF4136 domain-containing protein n=1 Tax=uncultured Sulfurovum sp. TaxID=269237 RepID=A0A6S6TCZ1_9BACT|nr:MAG: Unknown protein [uncultured Sulfurovum sp.]
MIYMKTSITFITLLLLSACTSTATMNQAHNNKHSSQLTHTSNQQSTTPNIAGTYNLVEGAYTYNNGSLALQSNIEASRLVIEKLDENNFGYYYVTKVEGLSTEGYFGGFTYKNGQFYQKVINYPTTSTTLRDNITLIKNDDFLKLTVKTINAKRIIRWKKSNDLQNLHASILPALKEERKAYIELFKEKIFPVQHLTMR